MGSQLGGRRLTFIGGTSRKFWEWRIREEWAGDATLYELELKWGRIGASGQSTRVTFNDKRLAFWEASRRESLKLREGYTPDTNDELERLRTAIDRERDKLPLRPVGAAPKPAPKPAPPKQPEPILITAVRRLRLRD